MKLNHRRNIPIQASSQDYIICTYKYYQSSGFRFEPIRIFWDSIKQVIGRLKGMESLTTKLITSIERFDIVRF